MALTDDYPRLEGAGYRETSEASERYNCIAWAAGVDTITWDSTESKGYYWPDGVAREDSVKALVAAYATIDYEPCDDGTLEPGFEKIAIYGKGDVYEHAARQLPSGAWTSKMGIRNVDIEHATVDALYEGKGLSDYGTVVAYLKRRRR